MAQEQEKKRGPGRPPGSKNKNKNSRSEKLAMEAKRIEQMQQEDDRARRINDVIWGITLISIGVFLLFTVIFNTTGTFGLAIHDACKGLFGDIAYALPFVFLIFGAFQIAGKLRHVGLRSSICGFFIILNMCLINSYRFIDPESLKYGFSDIVRYYAESIDDDLGGALGMEIGSLLVKFLGKPGLLIVAITILLISIFLIANSPISRFFDSLGQKIEKRRMLREAEMEEAERVTPEPKTRPIDSFEDTIVLPPNPSQSLLSSLWKSAEPKENIPADAKAEPTKERQLPRMDTYHGSEPGNNEDMHAQQAYSAQETPQPLSRDTFVGNLFKRITGNSNGKGLLAEEEEDYGYKGPRAMGLSNTNEYKNRNNQNIGQQSRSNPTRYGLDGYDPSVYEGAYGLDCHRPSSYTGLNSVARAATGLVNTAGATTGAGVGLASATSSSAASRGLAGVATAAGVIASTSHSTSSEPASHITAPGADNDELDIALAQGLESHLDDSPYVLPPISLLRKPQAQRQLTNNFQLEEKADLLEKTLHNFGVEAKVVTVTQGASVTRYEVQPATGVKVSSITRLSDDIALNLRAKSIRIEAPIPGKAAVGIEVENDKPAPVLVRELIESPEFGNAKSKITFAVGKDISGNNIVADLKDMPHLLIAGATGSGKSVCINTIITSFLYKAKPSELKLIMIDPKVVELANYNGIPHMLTPVVTDPKKAARALAIAVHEMDKRYESFAQNNVKDLESYNEYMRSEGRYADCKPQIVIIIDELADLMMAAPSDVENSICRLAQKARAAGMHLIVATQRPSVDVVTGLIKANIPSRIAFSVASQFDSRTILDIAGAEKLLGKGDMLFSPVGSNKPYRVQGPYISDVETDKVIKFVKREGGDPIYDEELRNSIDNGDAKGSAEPQDELTEDAIAFILKSKQASVSMLQRRFRIGYNRAARIIDEIEEKGIIGPSDGSRPRQVLFTEDEYYGTYEAEGQGMAHDYIEPEKTNNESLHLEEGSPLQEIHHLEENHPLDE